MIINSQAAKSKFDADICSSASAFVDLYNNSADMRRNRIGLLYSNTESQLLWNGNQILNKDAISQFWNALPETEHQ